MTADTRFDHAFKKTCKLISKIVELFLTDCNNIDLQLSTFMKIYETFQDFSIDSICHKQSGTWYLVKEAFAWVASWYSNDFRLGILGNYQMFKKP